MARPMNEIGPIIHADITKYKHRGRFDCATALFDVLNYIPKHDWWKNIPLDSGGFFIFDIWDRENVEKDGFRMTTKEVEGIKRVITPLRYDGKIVDLEVSIFEKSLIFSEIHRMYIWSHKDIEKFCGKNFEIVEVKATESWQKWYKLRRK